MEEKSLNSLSTVDLDNLIRKKRDKSTVLSYLETMVENNETQDIMKAKVLSRLGQISNPGICYIKLMSLVIDSLRHILSSETRYERRYTEYKNLLLQIPGAEAMADSYIDLLEEHLNIVKIILE